MQTTHRFNDALGYAEKLHREQQRKSTGIPYIAHLIGVASLVLGYGGDEDQAIAGLLHDAAEDQGGKAQLATIREKYGDRVADIVDACTDAYAEAGEEKPPWRERKERYIASLAEHDADVWLVSCADKLHNARSILRDYSEEGDALWSRFNKPMGHTLWYYRTLTNQLLAFNFNPIAGELDRVVTTIETQANHGNPVLTLD